MYIYIYSLRHVLLLSDEGHLYVWGRNLEGQLGLDGEVTGVDKPTRLLVGGNGEDLNEHYFTSIAAGNNTFFYDNSL